MARYTVKQWTSIAFVTLFCVPQTHPQTGLLALHAVVADMQNIGLISPLAEVVCPAEGPGEAPLCSAVPPLKSG